MCHWLVVGSGTGASVCFGFSAHFSFQEESQRGVRNIRGSHRDSEVKVPCVFDVCSEYVQLSITRDGSARGDRGARLSRMNSRGIGTI